MEHPYLPPAQAASQSERNVDQLLTSLSPTQLLYARKQLQNCTTLWIGFASFQALPTEVHLMISDLLDLPDVFSCRAVGRAWRHIWKSPALLHSLCRKFFEGLIELTPAEVDLDVLFLRAANKSLRRQLGPMHHTSPGCGYQPLTLLYHDRKLVYRSYDNDEIWPIAQLFIPGEKTKCVCEDENGLNALYAPHSPNRLNFTERALQGYHNRVVGMSGDLIALYESGHQFGGHKEHRLRIWHTALNEMKEMSLPGPIKKAYVDHESVITLLQYGGSILSYQWGGVLRDVPVETRYIARDDEADEKPHPNLASPQHDRVHPHKSIRMGLGVMYHPADRNVFYLVWQHRLISTYDAVASFEVVKYIYNQPVQYFFKDDLEDLALEQPAFKARSRQCRGFQDHVTYTQFGCEPVSEFGLFAFLIQGTTPYELQESIAECERPECGDQLDEWRVICFNVCTETFSELHYRSLTPLKEGEQTDRQILQGHSHKHTVRIWGPELWVGGMFLVDETPHAYVRRYIEQKSAGLVPLMTEGQGDPIYPLELRRAIKAHCHFSFLGQDAPDEIFVDADVMIMVYWNFAILVCHWGEGDGWEERALWPWQEAR